MGSEAQEYRAACDQAQALADRLDIALLAMAHTLNRLKETRSAQMLKTAGWPSGSEVQKLYSSLLATNERVRQLWSKIPEHERAGLHHPDALGQLKFTS